ncbi:hypothetical protein M8J77_014330 [Diaphorina citri]|nr:hypothetical protein M8J77_014330 [Diaphorina citri]
MFLGEVTSSTPQETAELFAQSFSSVYQESHDPTPDYVVHDAIDFNSCQFSSSQVFKALSSLPLKFSSGPDNIPPFILRKCASILSVPLSLIFNRSLSSGIFPTCWKSSYVIPIFKSGDRCNVVNYRGVCIQSAIPKVLDRLISSRLSFACKQFISNSQHGFITKRSTVTNLLCYQQDILEAFQSHSSVHSIYTDVAKAFDRVNTRFLLCKLRSYGIGESFLSWLASYLSDRTQSVRVGGSLSKSIQVTSGVGQGSHVGPLLFSLFFNDLPNVIKHSSVLMFADDVKLYRPITSSSDCHLLQIDIDALYSWMTTNGMTLSLHKCFVVEFTRGGSIDFIYTLDSVPLTRVDQIKDLGILLDQKLSLVPHITNLSMRCHRILGYIVRNSKGLSSDAFRLLYVSLVRSLLEYACVVWSPYYEVHINLLERVQRKFLFHFRYRHPSVEIQLPPLEERRLIFDRRFLDKLVVGDVDCAELLGLVKLDCHRRLRHKRTYVVNKCVTNYTYFSPLNRMMRDVNSHA